MRSQSSCRRPWSQPKVSFETSWTRLQLHSQTPIETAPAGTRGSAGPRRLRPVRLHSFRGLQTSVCTAHSVRDSAPRRRTHKPAVQIRGCSNTLRFALLVLLYSREAVPARVPMRAGEAGDCPATENVVVEADSGLHPGKDSTRCSYFRGTLGHLDMRIE